MERVAVVAGDPGRVATRVLRFLALVVGGVLVDVASPNPRLPGVQFFLGEAVGFNPVLTNWQVPNRRSLVGGRGSRAVDCGLGGEAGTREKVDGVSWEEDSLVCGGVKAKMAGAWWQDLEEGREPNKGSRGGRGGGEAVQEVCLVVNIWLSRPLVWQRTKEDRINSPIELTAVFGETGADWWFSGWIRVSPSKGVGAFWVIL